MDTSTSALGADLVGNVMLVRGEGESQVVFGTLSKKDLCSFSKTLGNMLVDLGDVPDKSQGAGPNDITLPVFGDFTDEVFEKVVDYWKYHAKNRDEYKGQPDDYISPWDLAFLKGLGEGNDHSMRFAVLTNANFMDSQQLLDVSCKYIASLIRGKTTEEMRKEFNITNDWKPEEEEEIRKQNPWAFEEPTKV